MKSDIWVINICNIRGIPIRIHSSFFIFLAWIGLTEYQSSGAPLQEILFVSTIFACILLHELGHALMARFYKIKTRDITLYPFGGIASISAETQKWPEFFIASAGPLVNIIIAAILYNIFDMSQVLDRSQSWNFAERLYITNIALVIFNLIPAYPMDGGRILRSLLSIFWGQDRATLITTRIAQILSLILGFTALYFNQVMLLIISAFVFINASRERFSQKTKSVVTGKTVKDIMLPIEKLITFNHGMTIPQAMQAAVKSLQKHFPVLYGDSTLGLISKDSLLQAAVSGEQENYISQFMDRDYLKVGSEDQLSTAMEKLETRGAQALLVFEKQKLIGMVTLENLMEFLLMYGLPKLNQPQVVES